LTYLPGSVSVSRTAWGIGRQLSTVEVQHPLLHVPFTVLDGDDGRALVDGAVAELDRTWLARGNRISTEFETVLRLLAAPDREVQGWIGLHEHVQLTVVAATDGELAVTVVVDDDTVYLEAIQPRALVDAVIALVPSHPPGRSHSLSVPRDVYERATTNRRAAAGRYLVDVRSSARLSQDVDALKALLAGPRIGGGRFYVATHDHMGRRRKSEKPLTYLDLGSGRVSCREHPNSGGDPWLTVAPASHASLAHDLNVMFAQLPGR
jgi:hypothetical protein